MSLSIDGNNIIFDGTVTVVNGYDTTTGVAYLVLTPDGGYGTLPVMSQGDSGLPPTLNFEVVNVDPGDALPDPNPAVTLVSAGGAGVASEYDITIYVHSGDDGPSTAFAVLDGTDISGTVTDEYVMAKKTGSSEVYFVPQKVGGQYVPGSITSTSGTSTGRTLATINVPAQPFSWRPRVFGSCIVTGTENTRVDLVARVDDATTGDVIGYRKGLAGGAAGDGVQDLLLIPAAPAGSDIPGDYGKVDAGVAVNIYLRAEQQAATSDSWSTSNTGYSTTFWVEVAPTSLYAETS